MKKAPAIILKTLFSLATLVAVERFCHHQTKGFRDYKILSHFEIDSQYEIASTTDEKILQANEILQQPFYFLGDGGQGYSFLSKDGLYVLKFFKLHHMRTSPILKKLPLFGPLKRVIDDFIVARENNHHKIFTSCKIAMEDLSAETAMLYLHLNPTSSKHGAVSVVDPIGVEHRIPLDKAAFALQKKADLAFTTLTEDMYRKDEAAVKEVISSFISFIANLSQKGIEDLDSGFRRNYGTIQGKLMEIDVGSFKKNSSLQDVEAMKEELLKKTKGLRKSLDANYPEMIPFFEESLNQACQVSTAE